MSIYRGVAGELRAKIRTGELPVGGGFPSRAELARDYGIAPVTAKQAVAVLAAEGLIRVQQGRRTVVIWNGLGEPPPDEPDDELTVQDVRELTDLIDRALSILADAQRRLDKIRR